MTTPSVPGFAGPPDVSVGTARGADRPLAVYSRPSGGNEDLFALDLLTGREHRVVPVSTARADEVLPSLHSGRLVFVRRGGSRPGVYYWNGRGAARRVAIAQPSQTAVSDARVAYATASRIVVRRLSGRGTASTFRPTTRPRSLLLTRYQVAWLERDGRVVRSDRFTGEGPRIVRVAQRGLPPATQSIALDDAEKVALRLGPDGLKQIIPLLAFR